MTLVELWYPPNNQRLRWSHKILGWLLSPIAGLYAALVYVRRWLYRAGRPIDLAQSGAGYCGWKILP